MVVGKLALRFLITNYYVEGPWFEPCFIRVDFVFTKMTNSNFSPVSESVVNKKFGASPG